MKRKAPIISLVLVLLAVALGFGAWHYWTHRYDELIVAVAHKYDLEPALVKAVIYEESFFNPRARSSQNAVGLMQVTPVAAQEWMSATSSLTLREAISKLPDGPPQEREPDFEGALSDPTISLHVGCWYLNSLLNRYKGQSNHMALALAAYNAGPNNVEKWIPTSDRSRLSQDEFIARIEFPATRSYVRKVFQHYDDYKKDARLDLRP